jgi:hypothetical protein
MSTFHTLTIGTPTRRDYLNGGFGVVAQCSCGRYEFTSPEEAAYWHWLHRTTPTATPFYLLSVLVDRPMPEGWTEPADPETAVVREPRGCVDCSGQGTIEMSGATGGRFYAVGSRRTCEVCGGSGTLDVEQAREASVARIAAMLATPTPCLAR